MNLVDKILLEASTSAKMPRYLFHATPSYNYNSIKKEGLKLGFDKRIYLATSFGAAAEIAQQLHQTYKVQDDEKGVNFYSVFIVDTNKLKGFDFIPDEDYNEGWYVTKPIPKQAIKHYESVKIK
jgi:RNA:NAD 2'-phosphotransferase (TPT1/KptA family)